MTFKILKWMTKIKSLGKLQDKLGWELFQIIETMY